MLRKLALAFALAFVFAQAAQAQISSVVRGGGSTNDPPQIAPNPLGEDELCFVDRTHEYNDVPSQLVGIQYVMVANNDKTVADYTLEVTVEVDAILYLLIDNRVGDDDNTNPPALGGGVMDWVPAMGFSDTGLDVGVDEGGDGDVDQTSSVYAGRFPAGSVIVLEQDDGGGRNMYGVAAQPSASSPLPLFSGVGFGLLIALLLGGGAVAARRVARKN